MFMNFLGYVSALLLPLLAGEGCTLKGIKAGGGRRRLSGQSPPPQPSPARFARKGGGKFIC